MKVKFIPADLSQPMEFRTVADDNKLHEVQQMLGGDCYVEMVRLGRYPITHQFNHKQTQTVPRDGSLYMLIDEDGLRKQQLSVNHRASALYGTQYHGSPIVGDAILLGEEIGPEGPDWSDYPLED